jgi:hypothetical protein
MGVCVPLFVSIALCDSSVRKGRPNGLDYPGGETTKWCESLRCLPQAVC